MDTVTLQVPMNYRLKKSAQKVAIDNGFSSLQEVVRVFLANLVSGKVGFEFSQPTSDKILTPKQEKVLNRKYRQVVKETKSGDGFTANSVEQMMKYLRS